MFIVGIAGTSGAGKSTVVRALVKNLDNAIALHFDDYEGDSTYPADLKQWIEDGGDMNAFQTPQLLIDIGKYKAENEAEILIIEEPTGRSRDVMHSMMDYLIFLEIPYEIALARKVMRILDEEEDNQVAINRLRGFSGWYLSEGYRFYPMVDKQVVAKADLVVNGLQAADLLAEEVRLAILRAKEKAGD